MLVTAAMAFAPIGILSIGATIVFKRATSIAAVIVSAMTFVSGAVFPASELPDGLQSIGQVMPTWFAYEGLRSALFSGGGWYGDAGALAIFAAVGLPCSMWLLTVSLRKGEARRHPRPVLRWPTDSGERRCKIAPSRARTFCVSRRLVTLGPPLCRVRVAPWSRLRRGALDLLEVPDPPVVSVFSGRMRSSVAPGTRTGYPLPLRLRSSFDLAYLNSKPLSFLYCVFATCRRPSWRSSHSASATTSYASAIFPPHLHFRTMFGCACSAALRRRTGSPAARFASELGWGASRLLDQRPGERPAQMLLPTSPSHLVGQAAGRGAAQDCLRPAVSKHLSIRETRAVGEHSQVEERIARLDSDGACNPIVAFPSDRQEGVIDVSRPPRVAIRQWAGERSGDRAS